MESIPHPPGRPVKVSTPPVPRSRLPNIGVKDQRQAYSAPPDYQPTEDPLLGGRHSKLYQRRKEIEAELRREFKLPEEAEAVLSQIASRRAPAAFGIPPPVPKPRQSKSHLPPIPKPSPEAPRKRWGSIDEADNPGQRFPSSGIAGSCPAGSKDDGEEPWWKAEQQALNSRRRGRQSSVSPVQSPTPSNADSPVKASQDSQLDVSSPSSPGSPSDRSSYSSPSKRSKDQTVNPRRQSWRNGPPGAAGADDESAAVRCEGRSMTEEGGRGSPAAGEEPWKMK
ncbi:unnamed protein product, partial [Polarella glacialis]